MKGRNLIALTAILFLLSMPLTVRATDHGQMEKGMNMGATSHGQTEGMTNGGMSMMKGMVMLGTQTESGIKAMAHIKDIHEAMAKMGMNKTHHLMVMFTDLKTGKPIGEGTVAVKIKDPSGNVGKPIMLMGMMPGGFGADITLPEKGEYEFIVGSKLADGQKRTFEFKEDLR